MEDVLPTSAYSCAQSFSCLKQLNGLDIISAPSSIQHPGGCGECPTSECAKPRVLRIGPAEKGDEVDDYISMVAIRYFGPCAKNATFQEQMISVLIAMKESFKKDARVWLHKGQTHNDTTADEYEYLRSLALKDLMLMQAPAEVSAIDDTCSFQERSMALSEMLPARYHDYNIPPRETVSAPNVMRHFRPISPVNHGNHESDNTNENKENNINQFQPHYPGVIDVTPSSRRRLSESDVTLIIADRIRSIRRDQEALERELAKRRCLHHDGGSAQELGTIVCDGNTTGELVDPLYGITNQRMVPPTPYYSEPELRQTDPEMIMYFNQFDQPLSNRYVNKQK